MTTDLGIELLSGGVGLLEIRRPPNNFFDADLIEAIASAAHELSQAEASRVLVLAAEGKHFCVGAGGRRGRRFGLALAADFRVASPTSRFAANFSRRAGSAPGDHRRCSVGAAGFG